MRFSIFLLFAVLLSAFGIVSAQDDTPNRFGVVEGFWLPDQVCDLGVGWERIIFDWREHQPTGPDDWHTLNVDDRWLAAAQACNREVVALLKHTPVWATDSPTSAGVPLGLYLPVDDPGNLWANFVRRAAEYYAERGVRHFIIWNEPDIDPGTYGFEFDGTLEDYAQLLKVAYLAAKEGNPDAIIHVAGTTYWHDVNVGRRLYVDRLLELLTQDPDAAANNYYFDALSLHIYFRTDTVWQIVHETHDVLAKYGLTDKSIWITEMNASPNLDPQWQVERPNWQITLDQQAAFLVQGAALGLAAGADHMAVYKFFDWNLPPGGESFGLLRADASARPAFTTWQTVIRQFGDVEGGALAQSDRVSVVRLNHADGRQTLVAWSRTAAPVLLQIASAEAESQLVDQYGNIVMLRPLNGVYTLSLPGATCNAVDGCPVGGLPLILVQQQGDSEIAEVMPEGANPLNFVQE